VGAVESLNVAVATGVCLYEATRRRLAATAGRTAVGAVQARKSAL
jgi:hypothetical protein